MKVSYHIHKLEEKQLYHHMLPRCWIHQLVQDSGQDSRLRVDNMIISESLKPWATGAPSGEPLELLGNIFDQNVRHFVTFYILFVNYAPLAWHRGENNDRNFLF